jgi:two-component system, LytTR family, response regulator LytT
MSSLSVLAVDDEAPALDELEYLLRRVPSVASISTATSATAALRLLQESHYDAVLLDIRMPGLGGLELARVLSRFAEPPAVVFVTAHEQHAIEAFDVHAVDYLLKPPSEERLARALERVADAQRDGVPTEDDDDSLDVLAVDVGRRVIMVDRDDIAWVQSAGDYVRLHTRNDASYLLRLPMSVLEQRWNDHGFVRIHRGYLVALSDVTELRSDSAQTTVTVAGVQLPVSRRHLRELRERLVRASRRSCLR